MSMVLDLRREVMPTCARPGCEHRLVVRTRGRPGRYCSQKCRDAACRQRERHGPPVVVVFPLSVKLFKDGAMQDFDTVDDAIEAAQG